MKILIYTKKDCSFCDSTKIFLRNENLDYTECEIGVDITREDFISLFPEQKTVPLIFINDVKVGGYNDLIREHRTGNLSTYK